MRRFKIDYYNGSRHYVFGLFFYAGKNWRGREKWELVDSFDNVEDAKKLYERIKNLPEYLP